jgi:uncharacterized protein (DUF433 family)
MIIGEGMTLDEVIQEYAVTYEQILASLTYSLKLLNYETVYSMEKVNWDYVS